MPRTPKSKTSALSAQAALPMSAASARTSNQSDTIAALRGIGQLAIDAVVATTDIAEHLHRTILDLSPVIGATRPNRTGGIPGFVYGSVRTVARTAGTGVDMVLAHLAPRVIGGASASIERAQRGVREATHAALNGVVGDHLDATGNPLAIAMRLRQNGDDVMPHAEGLVLRDAANANGRLMILAHGLCMNDLQWLRDGHDHGAELADAFGYTPLYLHYNSGRRISVNGRAFARLMQELFERWPTPIDEIAIVGHSMGGLVTRSACEYAKQAEHPWLERLKRVAFLGTPHHGAPLERAGNRVDRLLRASPYTAPFARLGQIRSAGVQDLRYSNLRDEDWIGRSETHADDPRTPVALPDGVECYAIAASTQRATMPNKKGGTTRTSKRASAASARLRGDGLVAVNSALGIHEDPEFSLPIPPARQAVVFGVDHFDLLGSREVYDHLHAWLSECNPPRAVPKTRKRKDSHR
jgi:pimeloyl-ACP methyl ester carboxylesterase